MTGALSSAYGALAAWRRARYARGASRRRRLARPVVSVGNLRVGGSGKTPIVEYVARLLVSAGERPAILTRGYARRVVRDGVTVVSDGSSVLAPLDEAGDEPLMLARALPTVPVLVGADRFLSGVLAERRFAATVHVLDDGFQHLALARDVDLLLVSEADLTDRPLPAGRLREPIGAAAAADAALVTAGSEADAERIARALRVPTVFRVTRSLGRPRGVDGARGARVVPPGSRVLLLTGIARPDRFASDVAAHGWVIAGTMAFRDHHQFTPRDVANVTAAAQSANACFVLTTEKDAVRLAPLALGDLAIASVPLDITIEPSDIFRAWLLGRIGPTSNQQPATSDQQPVTSNQRPATSNQRPATSNQQPATSDQQPATSNQQPGIAEPRGAIRDERATS